jgi:hypothetical protein
MDISKALLIGFDRYTHIRDQEYYENDAKVLVETETKFFALSLIKMKG